MTIEVGLTRTVDATGVLAALAARGIAGELSADGLGVVFTTDDGATVGRGLDTWVGESGLPFVPVQVDPTSYALVPPAG